jgi:superfamily II RNA helicase
MSEFTIITKLEFESFLPKDFVVVNNSSSKEIIYDIPSFDERLKIRIYSSIDIRTEDSREIGEDAIRCVLIDLKSTKPIDKGKRTHRMTNWKERLSEKIEELKTESKSAKFCKTCGSAMQLRETKNGSFWGCCRFPLCTCTMSLNGKYRESLASSQDQTKEEKQTIKCPKCNGVMTKRSGMRGPFYGCTNFFKTGCKGTRTESEVETYGIGAESEEKINPVSVQTDFKIEAKQEIKKVVDVPSEDNDVELIETSKYPHIKFKFEKFNPVQSRVFQYYDQDINLIVAAATSAGKTTIAEMLMGDSVAKGKKAAFLSPLKAVSQEKYDDWKNPKHTWSQKNVSIVTGDYVLTDKRVEELNKANIIIMTNEMMDSRTRRIHAEKNDWLLDIGTVVLDESHLLGINGRGDRTESAIIRFTKQNPSCRIVFLSATMPNVSELAGWLTLLNGKRTELINSNYRPIELEKHYIRYNDMGRYQDQEKSKIAEAINLTIEKVSNGEQCIVFVHSKKTGEEIKRTLESMNIKCDFHSADLTLAERIDIEQKTKTKEIKVLIATSTLSWGINI